MASDPWKEMEELISTNPVQLDIFITLAFTETQKTAFEKHLPQFQNLLRIFCTLNAELRNEFKAKDWSHLKPLSDLLNNFPDDEDKFNTGLVKAKEVLKTQRARLIQDCIQTFENAPSDQKDNLTKKVIKNNDAKNKFTYLVPGWRSPNEGLPLIETISKSRGRIWKLRGSLGGLNVTKKMIPQWAVDIVRARLGWLSFHLSAKGNLSSAYVFVPKYVREALVDEFSIDTDIKIEDDAMPEAAHPIRRLVDLVNDDIESDMAPLVTSESEVEDILMLNPQLIEPEMTYLDRQVVAGQSGKIDLLMEAPDGALVVVELKKEKADRGTVGQIQAYLTWAKHQYPEKKVRGVIVADGFDRQLLLALRGCKFNVVLVDLRSILSV